MLSPQLKELGQEQSGNDEEIKKTLAEAIQKLEKEVNEKAELLACLQKSQQALKCLPHMLAALASLKDTSGDFKQQ